MVATKRLTVAEFDAMDEDEAKRYELIDGELVDVEPVGGRHGMTETSIGAYLYHFVVQAELGEVFSSDTHFLISAERGKILKPDAAFVREDRMPEDDVWQRTIPFAPDLAVEVVSPSNPAGELKRRVKDYLDAGVRMIWIVRPEPATVTIIELGKRERVLGIDDTLDGGDVLPGFALPLRRIFRRRRNLDG